MYHSCLFWYVSVHLCLVANLLRHPVEHHWLSSLVHRLEGYGPDTRQHQLNASLGRPKKKMAKAAALQSWRKSEVAPRCTSSMLAQCEYLQYLLWHRIKECQRCEMPMCFVAWGPGPFLGLGVATRSPPRQDFVSMFDPQHESEMFNHGTAW